MDGIDKKLKEINHFDRIYLGFSGGLDSRVLLELLLKVSDIRKKMVVIHVNHGLSQQADFWESTAKNICNVENVRFQSFSVKLENNRNLEESARNKRYEVFESLLDNNRDVLLLAHHQNDQAETLLLHLFRGAGIDGLSAMPEWRILGKGQLYRPLLNISRDKLEAYANENQLTWIEDESNENTDFNRNFLRHQILPLLETRWSGVIKNLSRSAKHCAVAREQIRTTGLKNLENMMDAEQRLDIQLLQQVSRAEQMQVIRLWLNYLDFKMPDQDKLERLFDELIPASKDANPIVQWKEGKIRRYQNLLYAIRQDDCATSSYTNNDIISAIYGKKNVEIRFRKGGEKIKLSGKTRDLKTLFQLWKVPPWERNQIPLIYVDNILACVQGFAIGDNFSDFFKT